MTEDLFSLGVFREAPLAHRMRPRSFKEFVGQEHLLASGKFLHNLLKGKILPSLILWGPPGSGKTTMASLLATEMGISFVPLSAVTSGIREVREVIATAEEKLKFHGKKTLLFIDEIHRFNKAQQDALLPHVERGTITLIGATTENPSFEVISPLLSRCEVVILKRLESPDLKKILDGALQDKERGYGSASVKTDPEAEEALFVSSEGDARKLLNTVEIAVESILPPPLRGGGEGAGDPEATLTPTLSPQGRGRLITLADIQTALQQRPLYYDKKGEDHYNVISAFIKSMRDSDPDAALYYLARMLESGEDPLFIARRMAIFASEDIGNADPQALSVAVACKEAFQFIGDAEGWIPLAQCAAYLASALKSTASYAAYKEAREDVHRLGSLPVPMVLRNAVTDLMKKAGYGAGYQYAHDKADHIVSQQHLPDELKAKKYYRPTGIGYEAKIREWLDKVELKRK